MSIPSNHDSSESHLLDGSDVMRECPFCESEYAAESVCSLKQTEDAELAHLVCETCGHAVMVLIGVSEFGMSTLGIVTDLTVDDAKRTVEFPEISPDDVLNFHTFIRDGRLFEKHILLSAKGVLETY